jgi:NAD(P)-dependent dehydrogenase (short-subunit alcohol dehydrogenase family)
VLRAPLYRGQHTADDRRESRDAILTTGKAIVTGGGSGVGRATALALAEAGWQVIVAGRRRDAIDAVCAEGGDALSAEICDVTDEASVRGMFAAAAARLGRIDLLFNNAGVAALPAAVADVSLDDWEKVLATNVTGAFLCAREAFRHMSRQDPQGGRIINNGSLSAQMPRPYSTAYTVSKHAVTGLTRMLALEGRAHNIACGQIDIGNAATDMTRVMARGVPQADGSLAVEPTIDPANIAASVVHMAGLPLDANVLFMTVMATKMPFIGRG